MTTNSTFSPLEIRLAQLETGHSAGLIDMGLDRADAVRRRLNSDPACPVITVAGTNGKGSCCAFLTAIYKDAGYRTGTLTSPHLLRFNERIAVNGIPVSDDDILASFDRIDAVRGDISLTYFEYNTLAAVDIFSTKNVDVMILEVGLGGRLDAVNIFDADVAVVTSVGLDHQQFLGTTVEEVAFEKAGILRPGKPAVCGQIPIPDSMKKHARDTGACLLEAGRDFDYRTHTQQWDFNFHPSDAGPTAVRHRYALPIPALRGRFQLNNAACALAAVACLENKLPVDTGAVRRGLTAARNPGRFQVLPGRPLTVLDVAHNPHAAAALHAALATLPYAARRIAVFGVLADKDVDGIIAHLKDSFDEWHIAPLPVPRSLSAESLAEKLRRHSIENITVYNHIEDAYHSVSSQAGEDDRIVVFGSFHTVAGVVSDSSV